MKRLLILSVLILMGNTLAHADIKISASAKLMQTNWRGNNNVGGAEFEKSATQASFGVGFQKQRLYGRISVQGAEFIFDGPAPAQETKTSRNIVTNATIDHTESDILVGYYFWPQISLFVDIKSIVNKWQGSDYKMSYTGLGVGVSGFRPVNKKLGFYASFGLLLPFSVEATDETIGEGTGAAVDVGMSYLFFQNAQLFAGLKSQANSLEFDNGNKQEHGRSGLYLGLQYQF